MPLTDAQWARIDPLLPGRTPKRDGRWRDHREVIDAIAFKFQTGTQWVHLPENTATGEASTTGCGCGPSTAPGSECSPRRWLRPTRTRAWRGRSRSVGHAGSQRSGRAGREHSARLPIGV
ncbi:transposase [Streptomyces kronopolitis]|uniref:transposase n=1 Tax=Streptomyces kronopolitis TaxID=1612435 RepID=UPI0036905606